MSIHYLVLAFAYIYLLGLCSVIVLHCYLFLWWLPNFLHICLISSTYPRMQRPGQGPNTVPYIQALGTYWLKEQGIWDSVISEIFRGLKNLSRKDAGCKESQGGSCGLTMGNRDEQLCGDEQFCNLPLLKHMWTNRDGGTLTFLCILLRLGKMHAFLTACCFLTLGSSHLQYNLPIFKEGNVISWQC